MALDLDGAFLYHLTSGGTSALKEAISRGVTLNLVDGSARSAFEFIVNHAAKDQTIPSAPEIEDAFGLEIQETSFGRKYVFDELIKRAMFRRIGERVIGVETALKDNDPIAAYELILQAGKEIGSIKKSTFTPISLFALGQPVKEEYALIESGQISIPTPWPSMTKMTLGWWPGTNHWFAARPGQGKSWISLVIARVAWLQRFNETNPKVVRTLIVSPEMLKGAFAERFFTANTMMPYGQVVGASLPSMLKKKFFDGIDDLANQDGIWIMDAADLITPASIEAAVEDLDIDLLICDAAYKVKWTPRPKDRFENLFIGVEFLSNLAKRDRGSRPKLAVVANTQMNRQGVAENANKGGSGGKKHEASQASIAMADNISWEADSLFLVRQEQEGFNKSVFLDTSKVRRMAEFKSSIQIRWDMVNMDFSEVISGGAAAQAPNNGNQTNATIHDHGAEDAGGYEEDSPF